MWKIFLAGFVIIAIINEYWDEKAEHKRNKKRKYKIFKGITYFITSGLSLLIVEQFGKAVFVYTIAGIILGIGSILSAINPNIRNIYTGIFFDGIIVLLTVPHFYKHIIIFLILHIILLYGFILTIKEGIQNMRDGIDPDIIEEEKAARKKRKFKIVKLIIRVWK